MQDEPTFNADHIRQILFYFRRIRVFTFAYTFILTDLAPHKLLGAVSKHGILFPNLRVLDASGRTCESDISCVRFIVLTAGEHLRRVSCHDEQLVSIHRDLPRHGPNLRRLSITISSLSVLDDNNNHGCLFCTLLPGFSSLEYLSVTCCGKLINLDEFAIKASQISSLRSLVFIHVSLPDTNSQFLTLPKVQSTADFGALKFLHLTFESIAYATCFLQSVCLPRLTALNCSFHLHARPASDKVAALCRAIASSCRAQSQLSSLHDHSKLAAITITTRLPPGTTSGLSTGSIPSQVIRPLLQFPAIYALVLVSKWPWRFDNETVAAMNSAWPALRGLSVIGSESQRSPTSGSCSSLDVQTLRALATSTSLLSLKADVNLGMKSQIAGLMKTLDVIVLGRRIGKVTEEGKNNFIILRVCFSPMDTACVCAAAVFLSRMFPHLEYLYTSWKYEDPNGQNWGEVGKLIGKNVVVRFSVT